MGGPPKPNQKGPAQDPGPQSQTKRVRPRNLAPQAKPKGSGPGPGPPKPNQKGPAWDPGPQAKPKGSGLGPGPPSQTKRVRPRTRAGPCLLYCLLPMAI